MAKQSSTKAPPRPGKTTAVAPQSSAAPSGRVSSVVIPMLREHLRVQGAAAALRQAATQLPAENSLAGDSSAGDSPARDSRESALVQVPPMDERDFYPAHDQRSERPQYDQVHKRLCITMDLPCLVCGVRSSTLADPCENRYGARQLETHHHVIEWTLAGAVDVARFNKTIRPHLMLRQPSQPVYQRDMSAQEVRDWVDHSEDNLWVLCDVHHRHKELGIHDTPYPLWCPQDLLRPDFADYVREQSAVPAAPAAPVTPLPVLTPVDKPTMGKPSSRSTANRITAKLKVASLRPK